MTVKKMLWWLSGCQHEAIVEEKKHSFNNWIIAICHDARYILALIKVNISPSRRIRDEYYTFLRDKQLNSNSNSIYDSCRDIVFAVDISPSVDQLYRHSKVIRGDLARKKESLYRNVVENRVETNIGESIHYRRVRKINCCGALTKIKMPVDRMIISLFVLLTVEIGITVIIFNQIVPGMSFVFYVELVALVFNFVKSFILVIYIFEMVVRLLRKIDKATMVTDTFFRENPPLLNALGNKIRTAWMMSGYSGSKEEEQFHVFKLSCR